MTDFTTIIATYAADMKTLAAETPAPGDPRIAVLNARWRAIEANYGADAMAALEAHFEEEGK